MSVQNPTIPTATQAKGIDAIVLDLQTHLDTSLVWLTNGMGRAYRLSKVRTDQTTVFLPEVYLGVANRYDYFAATPDNDKQGQNILFVGDATLPDQQKGFYGWVEHDVGIIFSANLELIDSALLVTEDFTEHLIQDVREALIRDLVGKSYRLNIDSITREFDDVYAEFDVSRDRGVAHAPMTHFRVNCTITFKEDCAGVSLDRCGAILQNLSSDDLLNCILPTYDFSTTAVQNATTAQQQSNMTDWLCTPVVVPPPSSMSFDGTTERIVLRNDPLYEFDINTPFTLSAYVKLNSISFPNIFNKFSTGGVDTGIIGFFMNTQKVRFKLQATATRELYTETTAAPIPLNTWFRFDWVYEGDITQNKMYFNGVLQAQTDLVNNLLPTDTINDPTLSWHLGNSVALANGVDGFLHEIKMYNVALSGAEILTDNTDLLAFNNGTTSSYTPVRNADLVQRNRTGTGAVYGVTDWCFPDESANEKGSQSVLMEESDRSSDIPLIL